MLESDYWVALEFRVCREFAGTPANHLRFLWCDGFLPEQYTVGGPSPCIKGRVCIANGRTQDKWEFTLFLNHSVGSPSEIDWASLLPPENVTGWLAIDWPGKRIQIEPSAAVADAAPDRGST
jgi:hypothetical protein